VGVAVAAARGVADGVPGPGVFDAVGVTLGVRVSVGVPSTGVLVGRGRWVGARVGGRGVMVTMGVTGRRVGEGVGVDVWVGVADGVGCVVGLSVLVGEGVSVLVGVLVGVVGSISKLALADAPSVATASTWWPPGPDRLGTVGVVNDNWNVPSPPIWTWPKKYSALSQ
jgi:hypothetical protein